MGFSPSAVGLAGEHISGHFLEPRPDGCPHKGLDISSSGVPKSFCAGIYGRVVPPDPALSQWGTIAVEPFNDPSATIQYLHASSSNVVPGDLVAPWTILGKTGNTSPTPVPIHLHIQVAFQRAPTHACWGNRDFVNPETWETTSVLLGAWTLRGPNFVEHLWIDTDASSGAIGHEDATISVNRGRCSATYKQTFDIMCVGNAQKNALRIHMHFTGSNIIQTTCPLRIHGTEADAEITVDSASGFTMKIAANEHFPERIGVFTKGILSEDHLALAPQSLSAPDDGILSIMTNLAGAVSSSLQNS